jgi:hypothetical protein
MRKLVILVIHVFVTFVKLLRHGGIRAIAAESLLLKHQLVISHRGRERASNLTTFDLLIMGLTTLFISPLRIKKPSVVLKPATL